ncbi:FAD-binding oxidoreductase [Streptomyces bambusae]|uniref:FAD-binding protein n=1 Tax=Streptomyces bambusae TaxID=1550616 RepID=A0ABS6Z0W2_9ACTN|nr:FAD-binding oxidoreductase [Streptomyces bambusae]MBW5481384.1 FAD-binding protein [Streptomyces bambusae]
MSGDPAQIDVTTLANAVSGPVLTRGQEGYEEELTGFQTGYRHDPAVVVGAADAEDVRAAVAWAAEHGLPVALQSTGHGITVLDRDGLVITTRRLDSITVDAGARTARIGAGARWEQVIAQTFPHGLSPLCGSAGHVGVVGYTLAGGLGLLAREFGYAADLVKAIEVVTADGQLREVTADSDPDLFWALRGGRENFGAVTALEVSLLPVAKVYGGGLYFDAAEADKVLAFFKEWTATAPETVTASLGMIEYPPIPVFPEPLRGRHVVHVRFATTDLAGGPELVRPWREASGATVIHDHLGELDYPEVGSIYAEPTFSHAYDGNAVLLSELDQAVLDAVRRLAGPGAEVPCIVDLRHLGGALARQPEVPNAVPFREAAYILRVLSGSDDAPAEAIRSAHAAIDDAVRPWTVGRSLNFVYGERSAEAFADELWDTATRSRLAKLKAVYDPANVFRTNLNIVPAG